MCASLSHIDASLCLFYVAMGLRRRNRRNLKSEGPLLGTSRHLKLPRKSPEFWVRVPGNLACRVSPSPIKKKSHALKAQGSGEFTSAYNCTSTSNTVKMSGMFEQPRNAGTLFLGGTKISGADIRDQNGNYCVHFQ